MPARSRTKDDRFIRIGWCETTDGTIICSTSKTDGEHRSCSDFVGNPDGVNNFNLLVQRNSSAVIEGLHVHPTTGAKRLYKSQPLRGGWDVPPTSYSGFPSLLSEASNLAWKALARTNPNEPHVSLPTFIAELRDLPSLVKDWGGNLLKKAAKGHISWRWAIKPMIGDLRKLAGFQSAMNERIKHLRRLRDGKVLTRRASLGSDAAVVMPAGGVFLHSCSGLTVSARRRETHSYKQWATVQWKLDPSAVLPPEDDELAKLAYRLHYGLTSHGALATAWELTPWSWFADWFGGFGEIIAATNNTVPVTHSDVCLMRHSRHKRKYLINEGELSTLIQGEQSASSERKERLVASPILPFQVNFPVTDAGKWSILGSLAVLRGSR